MQDHGEKEMNAEEEKNMDKKKANKPTNQNCVHGSKNIQMVAMEIPVVIYCGFFVLLKCDPFEETPRKAEIYDYQFSNQLTLSTNIWLTWSTCMVCSTTLE